LPLDFPGHFADPGELDIGRKGGAFQGEGIRVFYAAAVAFGQDAYIGLSLKMGADGCGEILEGVLPRACDGLLLGSGRPGDADAVLDCGGVLGRS
jgi:hypothetical protein